MCVSGGKLNSRGENPMTLQNQSFILRTNKYVSYVILEPECGTILLHFKTLGYLSSSEVSVTNRCAKYFSLRVVQTQYS